MDMATGQSLFVLAVLCTIVLLWRGAWYLLGLASRTLRVLPRRVAGSRVWAGAHPLRAAVARSEEHTSELQSLMRISYSVFCLKNKKTVQIYIKSIIHQTTTHL